MANRGVPVLLIGFNRPELFKRLAEKVISWSPPKIYVALDGPRVNNFSDIEAHRELVSQVKSMENICDVSSLIQGANLGCRDAVVTALSWFFQNEEMGIILEDDCDPDDSFYAYCAGLLELLRDDPKVISISGHRAKRAPDEKGKLRLSRYPQVWGWASWRRAMVDYDEDISDWPSLRQSNWLEEEVALSRFASAYWFRRFDKVYAHEIDTWDYQLTFLAFKTAGLTVIPPVNLVRNVGFDSRSAHTRLRAKFESNSKRGSFKGPFDLEDRAADPDMDKWLERWSYMVWRSLVADYSKELLRHIIGSHPNHKRV